jgi:GLPGLI family protein
MADDSLEMVMIDGNGDTTRKKILNNKKWDNRQFFPFSVNITSTGNNNSAVIKFNNNEIAGNILPQIDFPDKIVFNKNRWYAHKDNRIRELPDIKVTMSSTDSIKNILGYRCRKYNVKEPVGGQQFYVWVCKDLPITLMPGGGYHPFPGAVLEMVYPERGARFIATSITKI